MKVLNKSIKAGQIHGRSFFLGGDLGRNGHFLVNSVIDVPDELGAKLIAMYPSEIEEVKTETKEEVKTVKKTKKEESKSEE